MHLFFARSWRTLQDYPSLFLNFQDDLPGCSLRNFTTSKVGDFDADRQMDIVNTELSAPYYL